MKAFEEWWIDNGFDWIVAWKKLMDKCLIKDTYSFSSEHKRLLKQYYDSNTLLVECLDSDCYVNLSTREFIKKTLLLPISEINKLRTEKQENENLTAS